MALGEWLNKGMSGPVEHKITAKLAQGLQPSVLKVENDSARHAGHAGDDGSGESHFNVLVVSEAFLGKNRIERQRMVYDLLADELKETVHALSLKTFDTAEYIP